MHLILNPSGAALDRGATRARPRARLVVVRPPPAQPPRARVGGGRVELTLVLAALLALSFAISP
jgi:hypothetical protein